MESNDLDSGVELTIPLKTLAFIIAKAREYDAEVAPVNEGGGSNPTDDDSRDVLEASGDNPTRQELVDALDSLNEDERVELLAMMWLGRGDFDVSEWEDALKLARERHDARESEYLAATPLLPDFLDDALSALGYAEEELEEASEA
jgi:hypothetical protein